MSSLWTPEGEHRVPRQPAPVDQPGASSPQPGNETPGRRPPAGSSPLGGPDAPTEEELRRLTEELAAAPVEDVIANHCYGLFELAALHLSVNPPQLAKASLAIDALGLLIEGLGDRLGQYSNELAEALNQLRLAFVRLSSASRAADGAGQAGE